MPDIVMTGATGPARLYAISQLGVGSDRAESYRELVGHIERLAPGTVVNLGSWEDTKREILIPSYKVGAMEEWRTYALDGERYPPEREAEVYASQSAYFSQQVEAAFRLSAIPFLFGGLHEMSLPLYEAVDKLLRQRRLIAEAAGHAFYYPDMHLDAVANIFAGASFVYYGLVNNKLRRGEVFNLGGYMGWVGKHLKQIPDLFTKMADLPPALKAEARGFAERRAEFSDIELGRLSPWYEETLTALGGESGKKFAVWEKAELATVSYDEEIDRLWQLIAFVERGGTVFGYSAPAPIPAHLFWSFDVDISSRGTHRSALDEFKDKMQEDLNGRVITGGHAMELEKFLNKWGVPDVAEIIVERLRAARMPFAA